MEIHVFINFYGTNQWILVELEILIEQLKIHYLLKSAHTRDDTELV